VWWASLIERCLEKGPNLIELIPDVLKRFRMKRYGAVTDVKKAFLQISVKKEDRNYMKFLWWEGDQLIVYQHCRVIFGITPFLLAAVIKHHLNGTQESGNYFYCLRVNNLSPPERRIVQ